MVIAMRRSWTEFTIAVDPPPPPSSCRRLATWPNLVSQDWGGALPPENRRGLVPVRI